MLRGAENELNGSKPRRPIRRPLTSSSAPQTQDFLDTREAINWVPPRLGGKETAKKSVNDVL